MDAHVVAGKGRRIHIGRRRRRRDVSRVARFDVVGGRRRAVASAASVPVDVKAGIAGWLLDGCLCLGGGKKGRFGITVS